MSEPPAFHFGETASPLVATAIHAGHDLRPEVAALMVLDDPLRFREEDPFTDGWTSLGGTCVVVNRSRFEVDLNRPREEAVYATCDQSWGLQVWDAPLPDEVRERSLGLHDDFYRQLGGVLDRAVARHGRFVVYDLHSYNHRRGGPGVAPQPPADNPDINLGTGTMDRRRWGAVADRFLADLSRHDLEGHRLDVRENVRFRGGYLSRWVHETYPRRGCALAIEVKKIFMDECTGEFDETLHKAVHEALIATVPGVLEALEPA